MLMAAWTRRHREIVGKTDKISNPTHERRGRNPAANEMETAILEEK